jgi:hypothetical protein
MALLAWLKDLTRRADEHEASMPSDFGDTRMHRDEDEAAKDWPTPAVNLQGLEVSEQPMNTVPDELREELLKPHRWRNGV